MAKDADNLVVAGTGTVYVAPLATAAPADPVAAPAAAWVDLGYTTEDGVTFRDGKTVQAINAWQSFHPIRRIITGLASGLSFVLEEWTKTSVPLALGGGTITSVAGPPAHYKYEPPAAGSLNEKSLMVDWLDGAKHYRLIVPKGMVTNQVETQLAKSGQANLPLTFDITGTDAAPGWYLLTDDPAFNPA